ncbi:MAG: DMT family protein, partial [Methyloceanibacter sp.]
MLFCSNLFMTLAWVSLLVIVLVSWGIAFVEYCFAVPANRGLLTRGAHTI